MNRLLLASRNKDKLKEIQQVLTPYDIELKSALDYEHLEEVEEDQDSFEGNALKKARYVHQETGEPALADDTGLEVDALDGAPGIYSARYAGEQATYQDNVDKLLATLDGIETDKRTARFRTVLALITGSQEVLLNGVCKGTIISTPRGKGGFGYDPVFVPEGYEKTFAELNSREKNKISHRGKALEKFRNFLENIRD